MSRIGSLGRSRSLLTEQRDPLVWTSVRARGHFVFIGPAATLTGMPVPDHRRSGDSRCCRPNNPPLEWVEFSDPEHEGMVELAAWLNSLHPWARDNEIGRVEALMERAARGQLFESGNRALETIKPIRTNPDIWELRHKALSKALRFYHGEPAAHPMALIALHRHIKVSDEQQQQHVEFASNRYISGAGSQWGMV